MAGDSIKMHEYVITSPPTLQIKENRFCIQFYCVGSQIQLVMPTTIISKSVSRQPLANRKQIVTRKTTSFFNVTSLPFRPITEMKRNIILSTHICFPNLPQGKVTSEIKSQNCFEDGTTKTFR